MSEVIAVRPPKTLREYLDVKKAEISSMLPTHVNYERFAKSALLAVARDPKLQDCSVLSLFTAVVNAAELGLDFTPSRGAAYIVKFGNQAVFMPGFRGLIDLAKRTGDVTKIEAHIVHEGEKFELEYGTNSHLTHVPRYAGESGKMIGAYAVAHFKDGTFQFEYMTKEMIDGIRKRSKAANNGPWVTDYDEMARKTVVRRLFKYLPSSSDLLDKAIEADNKAIGFTDFELEPLEDGEKTSRLADKVTATVEKKIEMPVAETTLVNEDTGEVVDGLAGVAPLPEPASEPETEKPKRGRPSAKKKEESEKPKSESLKDASPLEQLRTKYNDKDITDARKALDIRKLYTSELSQDEAKAILAWLDERLSSAE